MKGKYKQRRRRIEDRYAMVEVKASLAGVLMRLRRQRGEWMKGRRVETLKPEALN